MRLSLVVFFIAWSASLHADERVSPRTDPDAAQKSKAAWEWTVEERLADRFDPAKIREREIAYEARFPQTSGSPRRAREESAGTSGKQPVVYMIDGSRNPELFLPYELFDGLLAGLNPNEEARHKQRAYLQESIRRLGYDDEAFWALLESISAKYLPLRFGQKKTLSSVEVNAIAATKCQERYDALEAARALFGRKKFDIVLYTVMAPVSQYSEATLDDDPGAMHRRAETGCR
jgi:hypothetical protein